MAEKHGLEEGKRPGSLTGDSLYDDVSIDANVEKRLVRKLDMYTLPLLFGFYLLCFLDRTNIGNANVAGLSKDIGLTGYQYNIALSLFYICYSLIEIPSNLVLRKVGVQVWIPIIMLGFGLVSLCTAFIHNFRDLLIVRIFLGITEGGMMPACLVVLGRFYTRQEMVLRTAIYASSATVAGMIGGLLAYGLLQANVSIVPSWRAIFFFEGIITIGFGVVAFFVLYDSPSKAKYLTPEERQVAEYRIRRQYAGAKVLIEATKMELILKAFKNANTFACALGFGLSSLSLQGLALFIPTIIRSINPNFTILETQLKTVPVYACALVVSLSISWASCHYNRRGYAIIFCNIFAVCGYSMFLGTPSSAVDARYAAVFLCAMGIFTPGPLWLSWGLSGSGLDQTKAVAAGLIVGLGTMGSVVATWSYLATDAPRYMIGNSLNVSVVVASQFLAAGLIWYNKQENALREKGGRDYLLEGKTPEQIAQLGERHPEFRYVW